MLPPPAAAPLLLATAAPVDEATEADTEAPTAVATEVATTTPTAALTTVLAVLAGLVEKFVGALGPLKTFKVNLLLKSRKIQ